VGVGKYLKNGLISASALVLVGALLVPSADSHSPVLFGAVTLMAATRPTVSLGGGTPNDGLLAKSSAAVRAFASAVRQLSHPKALDAAFRSYYAYLTAHHADVKAHSRLPTAVGRRGRSTEFRPAFRTRAEVPRHRSGSTSPRTRTTFMATLAVGRTALSDCA